MKQVLLLGATGSIGASTLDVLRRYPKDFAVAGLAARRPGEAVVKLAGEFPGAALAVAGADASFAETVKAAGWHGRFFHGPDAAEQLVRNVPADTCVAGMGGSAGLRPAFAAAEMGLGILLANKEVLVSAGRLFMDAVRAGGAHILPLDSEHAALWQCLESRNADDIAKVIITASGGPFRTWTADAMARATAADAIKHPVWSMGKKISVDSATLANKSLELFEAQQLFDLTFDKLEVVVHPQSVVHGMVEFCDGGVLAHMGIADMRQPIAYMLFYPGRERSALGRLDLTKVGRLDFEAPDLERFPMLALGLQAGHAGGCAPVVYNAANEEAVRLFLGGRIGFPGIVASVGAALERFANADCGSLDAVIALHGEVEAFVRQDTL